MIKSLGEVEEQREGKENKHLSNENSLKKQKKEKRQLVKKKKRREMCYVYRHFPINVNDSSPEETTGKEN